MSTKPILRVTGLEASFGRGDTRQTVLHDISIALHAGETLGIVGESGSGKSVTSMSIMRLIPSPPISYDSGSIVYGDEQIDLLHCSAGQLRSLRGAEIAMIFQEPMTSLNPLSRCGEQVAEVLRLHKGMSSQEAHERVIELFEQVKLPDPNRAARAYPHELSGGQKQRVMIAMAISCEPKLLIADEPTTALDVTVQRDVIELLRALQEKSGMAMIFISHDLAVVSQISDEILVMYQGRIIEQGKSAALLRKPQEAYTRGLLSSRPPGSGRPRRLLTVADHLDKSKAEYDEVSTAERQQIHTAMYAQEALIEVNQLHTWYPIRSGILQRVSKHVKAVNGVSLKLYPGETLGVVGESGCGKSTLGRSIIGLESPQSGDISYLGKLVSAMNTDENRKMNREVQMIFQDPYSSLDPRMTIGDAIVEPMTVHKLNGNSKARKAKAIALLEQVGLLAEQYDRYPHEFSGGQRQRICIARTLALSPKVIICDESVSALDVSVQAQVLNLLNELKDAYGLSYIFISHDLSVVRYISDRVLVMQAGEVVESGEADALYASPQHPYTQKLIESAYSLDLG